MEYVLYFNNEEIANFKYEDDAETSKEALEIKYKDGTFTIKKE